MMQKVDGIVHNVDANENPPGGHIKSTGLVEGVILDAIVILELVQNSKCKCRENGIAITKLEEALQWLNWRTAKMKLTEIEGTHTEEKGVPII